MGGSVECGEITVTVKRSGRECARERGGGQTENDKRGVLHGGMVGSQFHR